jgi:endogenous inhibitor of DNA gyrase (YacG/DUF329 family)
MNLNSASVGFENKNYFCKLPSVKKILSIAYLIFSPFCSERCGMIDLGQWANEGYKIQVEINPENFVEDII